MQGKKQFTPQLFYSTGIDELVPQNNFCRRLNAALDLHFVYKATANVLRSRRLRKHRPSSVFQDPVGRLFKPYQQQPGLYYCADSLSIRLFLGYHLDEQLPWHSTISRTKQLYGEEVFLSLFQEVLRLSVNKGMVRGKRQGVDSAFVKANASMDSLIEQEVIADTSAFVNELNENSEYQITTERNW